MYKAYFAIEKKLRLKGYCLDRKELIHDFTQGEKNSLKALSDVEYKTFIKWLELTFKDIHFTQKSNPENNMRRKLIALLVHQVGFSMQQLDEWCIQYGKAHKPLNDNNYEELIDLVTQAEKVYATYVKGITKQLKKSI